MDNPIKYLKMNRDINLEKVYRFTQASHLSVHEELPEKARLEYKLSEVMTKLNAELGKMKRDVNREVEEQEQQTNQDTDLNVYHHIAKMISTKLNAQLE